MTPQLLDASTRPGRPADGAERPLPAAERPGPSARASRPASTAPSDGRHRVLVTTPLAAVALERLAVFFAVEVHPAGGRPANVEESAHILSGHAGAIIDADWPIDAALLSRLPCLRAVSTVGSRTDHLELEALTAAEVRATFAPDDAGSVPLDTLWARLLAKLDTETGAPIGTMGPDETTMTPDVSADNEIAAHVDDDPDAGWRPASLRRRRSGVLGLGAASLDGRSLSLIGQASLCEALGRRARDAGAVHVEWHERTPATAPEGTCVQVDALAAASSVGGPDALLEAFERRSLVAAEGLIAALGFGRDSWHPPYLLNPEVSCTSCC